MLTKLALTTAAFFAVALINRASAQNFKSEQAKQVRVKDAIAEKEATVKALFESKGFAYPPKNIFIRVFKREQVLELWASQTPKDKFELVKAYKFCVASGQLGPKRRMGDEQIPEGFYYVDRFNPASQFYLSLGVDYPNASDRILGEKGRLGGDIFIHGGCASIGCVPLGDESIKELYLIAVEARSAGQQAIPVHFFPTRFDQNGLKQLERLARNDSELRDFWANLKEGYDFFEKHRRLPKIGVDRRGRYLIGE